MESGRCDWSNTKKVREKPEGRWDNNEHKLLQKDALLGTARILRNVLDIGQRNEEGEREGS